MRNMEAHDDGVKSAPTCYFCARPAQSVNGYTPITKLDPVDTNGALVKGWPKAVRGAGHDSSYQR